MCEVTKNNYQEKLPKIRKSLEKSKFIAIDLEFSALQPLQHQTPRLFDNNKERYAKLRLNLLKVIPVQVGISAFHFDNDSGDYCAEVFNFYVAPATFMDLDRSFYFQASTLNFLSLHSFDFNKFAYLGIPYLNSEELANLEDRLKNDDLVGENGQLRIEFEDAVKAYVPVVSRWYNSCKVDDFLEIPNLSKKYKGFYEILYFLHKHLRKRFKNLWTFEQNGHFYVKKVSGAEMNQLLLKCDLNENLLNDLTGFTHVFNLLKSLKKPIIGHNILQDLMIMMNNFETTLPEQYSQFKSLINQLFPTIFDTKTIYYELRSRIPKEKLPESTSLEALFHYFKDGLGRHLAVDTTAIECNIDPKNFENYHEAGWDSFCAGYIFLRMGFYNIAHNYPKNKKFVTSEVISGLSLYKNRVNVIRGAASHIRIDGEDPSSNRPPWLIVESVQNEPVDVSDLMSTLGSFGFVDVKRISSKGDRVLVAVDNYRAAREISKTLKTHQKFQVKQYNFLKHSPIAQAVLLSAVTVSGTFLLWLTHSMVKR